MAHTHNTVVKLDGPHYFHWLVSKPQECSSYLKLHFLQTPDVENDTL